MDRYLLDIYWLKKAFGGDRIVKFDIKLTDGRHICQFRERWKKFLGEF